MNGADKKPDLARVGGLWKSKTKSGETMLAGPLGGARILILPNERKEAGSAQPDYYLCIVPADPKPGTGGGAAPAGGAL